MKGSTKLRIITLVVVMLALVLASCDDLGDLAPTAPPLTEAPDLNGDVTPGATGTMEPTVAATVEMTPTVDDDDVVDDDDIDDVFDNDVLEFEGETVNVIAQWAGSELDNFMAMVEPWEEATGATIEYEGTRDINAVVQTRVEGGNPPDIAGLSGPAVMRQFAQDGVLVNLSTFMDIDALFDTYDESWIDLARVDDDDDGVIDENDPLYGVFTKAAYKSMVWYNQEVFDEFDWDVPETWDEMIELSNVIVDSGGTPWCIGLESGAASGWPGTDWIEDIMLRTAGPETYDRWREHQIPWTDPEVRNAWEYFGIIVNNPEYVAGGTAAVLGTNFGESVYGLYTDPPTCYMHRQASFITDFIVEQFPDIEAETGYNFFVFPEIDPEFGTPALVAGDLFGMFVDEPVNRSFMEWIVSADAQSIWAERGGFLAPNTEVDTGLYPDPLTGQAGDLLVEADVVRFDASDLMPAAVNDAFLAGILQYVENPGDLDSILEQIESVAEEAYQEQAQ